MINRRRALQENRALWLNLLEDMAPAHEDDFLAELLRHRKLHRNVDVAAKLAHVEERLDLRISDFKYSETAFGRFLQAFIDSRNIKVGNRTVPIPRDELEKWVLLTPKYLAHFMEPEKEDSKRSPRKHDKTMVTRHAKRRRASATKPTYLDATTPSESDESSEDSESDSKDEKSESRPMETVDPGSDLSLPNAKRRKLNDELQTVQASQEATRELLEELMQKLASSTSPGTLMSEFGRYYASTIENLEKLQAWDALIQQQMQVCVADSNRIADTMTKVLASLKFQK